MQTSNLIHYSNLLPFCNGIITTIYNELITYDFNYFTTNEQVLMNACAYATNLYENGMYVNNCLYTNEIIRLYMIHTCNDILNSNTNIYILTRVTRLKNISNSMIEEYNRSFKPNIDNELDAYIYAFNEIHVIFKNHTLFVDMFYDSIEHIIRCINGEVSVLYTENDETKLERITSSHFITYSE